ncbi:MAG: hypothetical protein IJD60_11810 [Clostridia bacterium]|nr:hypothetical protein [Clostridia bacterium]
MDMEEKARKGKAKNRKYQRFWAWKPRYFGERKLEKSKSGKVQRSMPGTEKKAAYGMKRRIFVYAMQRKAETERRQRAARCRGLNRNHFERKSAWIAKSITSNMCPEQAEKTTRTA